MGSSLYTTIWEHILQAAGHKRRRIAMHDRINKSPRNYAVSNQNRGPKPTQHLSKSPADDFKSWRNFEEGIHLNRSAVTRLQQIPKQKLSENVQNNIARKARI